MAKPEVVYLCQTITKKGERCQRSAEYMFNNKGMCPKHHTIALEKQKRERELAKIYRCHGIVSESPKVLCAERHRCRRYPVPNGIQTTQLSPKIGNGVCRNYMGLSEK